MTPQRVAVMLGARANPWHAEVFAALPDEFAPTVVGTTNGRYSVSELALPFKVAGFHQAGQELLASWDATPDLGEHDRTIIDRWAETLGIAGWYEWVPYTAPK